MSTNVLGVLAEEAARQLPMPAYAYGVLAMVFFLAILGVTWTFRGNYNKHIPPSGEHGHGGHGGHGAHDGHAHDGHDHDGHASH